MFERLFRMFSQTFNAEKARPGYVKNPKVRQRVQFQTLVRVGVPSVLSGVIATLTFPAMALFLAGLWNTNPGTLAVLSQDSSQFVQNFLTVAGLLFSILVGQTCTYISVDADNRFPKDICQTISCIHNKKVCITRSF